MAELPFPTAEVLGHTIAGLRTTVSLDVDALARRSGLGPELIVAIEAGELERPLDMLPAIAAGLGISVVLLCQLAEQRALNSRR